MARTAIRALVVEDVRTDAELELRELKRAGLRVEYRVVETEVDFLRGLREFKPDLILSDFSMPQFDGMQALAIARTESPDVPFIFVSGTIGEEYAIRALKNGATDYVLKTNLVRLPAAVERALKDAEELAAKRKVEKELQERDAGLRRAQLMAELAHVITGADGAFESWSESLLTLARVPPSEMPRSTREWLALVHPEDRPHFRATSIGAAARHTRRELEYRLQHHDGTVTYVRQVLEPLEPQSESQRSGRWFNTLQNITRQKKAAAELQLSEARYRTIFEQAAVGIAHSSLGGDIQLANPKLSDMLGYTAAEMLRFNIRDLTHPEDFARIADARSHLQSESGSSYERELRLMRKDSSPVWTNVTTSLVRGTNREPLHFVSIVHDISERKLQQEKIARLTRVYAVLSGINALIVRVRERDDLFKGACNIAVEAGRFPLAWIGLVNHAEQQIVLSAWDGAWHDYVEHMPLELSASTPENLSVSAAAVAEGRAQVVNDIEHDPRFRLADKALERGLRSYVVLPLWTEGTVTALLAVYAEQPGFFDEEEMKLLNELAGDISFALAHIAKEEKLKYVALYDALTGLANQTLFGERLSHALRSAGQAGTKLALAVLDLERFRAVNSSLGRQGGDALLQMVAERIAHAAGTREWTSRVGADQFAVALTPVIGPADARRRLQDLQRDCFAEPYHVSGTEIRLSAKMGVTLFPDDGVDTESLLRNAEAALREAKNAGDPIVFYTRALTEGTSEELSLLNKLHRALENREFVLYYQPKMNLKSKKIAGVEALMRWRSPELGLVPPADFIPLMEETGLILEAGAWALSQAVSDHSRWMALGVLAPRVAVNVSAIQLRKANFVSTIEAAISRGARPTGIDLEITESLIMEDIETTIQKLRHVRGLGMEIAIDDFGTGYSSLGYLSKLPIQTIKIDRSFVITMLKDSDTMTLVQTIISLAHSLNRKVVAEGVDAHEQARILQLLRCDEMQGYLFSKPVPFEEVTALLLSGGGVTNDAPTT